MTEAIMNVTTNNSLQCILALNNLKSVYDPEIGLNVVDLGLIYRIEFFEERDLIEVDMTLTTRFCPMGESIFDNVNKVMKETFATFSVNVNLVFEPPWKSEMISEEGREFLNG